MQMEESWLLQPPHRQREQHETSRVGAVCPLESVIVASMDDPKKKLMNRMYI